MEKREKRYAIKSTDIKRLIPDIGYCFVSDHIVVDGYAVAYMKKEFPEDHQDSGWRFFSAQDTTEYLNDTNNISLISVNTVANYDRSIIPYLQHIAPSYLEKRGKQFWKIG